ncbi:MAG: 23S rRNA (adenine(2503)-C(2))-methyltransferase RlmN [Candidatus Gracilibacteria bacterium]|nr:23S rRNA (adenine(2503)-C(2))-methyltransferase RlmN [Candidatus Gracilibacteria bacterium]
MQKISIHDEDKLKEFLSQNKIPPFRYSQIENAIYKNFITDFNKIETIPKDLREKLKENFFYDSLEIDMQKTSENGQTTKILFKTKSPHPNPLLGEEREQYEYIEAVIMRHLTGRITLCVSCQVGCPMGCSFCATGKLGLKRNLEFYEIVEQIMYAAKLVNEQGGVLRNIVYMGMGEPMLNYDNVKKSIDIATAQKKINIANRRVTISTCGIVPGIKKFTLDFPQTSLAISLHAPNDEIRSKIMPVDHTYPLKDLMKALDDYVQKTNKRIFYEYIMINGVNDNIILADELGKLLKGRLAHVNFIPYNPGEGTSSDGFKPTPRFIIEKFQNILEKYGVVSTIRATMGDDIDAACGQLANKKD